MARTITDVLNRCLDKPKEQEQDVAIDAKVEFRWSGYGMSVVSGVTLICNCAEDSGRYRIDARFASRASR